VGCTGSSNKSSAKDILDSPVKVRPQNTRRGEQEAFGCLPWGLLGRAFESRFGRTSSNTGTLKDGAGQEGSIPHSRKGIKQISKCEERLVWGTKPKNGLRARSWWEPPAQATAGPHTRDPASPTAAPPDGSLPQDDAHACLHLPEPILQPPG